MNQALSIALLSARWDSGFCILFLHTFLWCNYHSYDSRFESHHHHLGRVTPKMYHTLNMRPTFNIYAYMHSARPTIHIYTSIIVLLQSHIMLYSREVTGYSWLPWLGASRASPLQYTSMLGCRQLINTVSLPHTNADNSTACDTDSMSRCNTPSPIYIVGISHLPFLGEYMRTLVVSYTYSHACFTLLLLPIACRDRWVNR